MLAREVTCSLKSEELTQVIQRKVYRRSSWEKKRESCSRENGLDDREELRSPSKNVLWLDIICEVEDAG